MPKKRRRRREDDAVQGDDAPPGFVVPAEQHRTEAAEPDSGDDYGFGDCAADEDCFGDIGYGDYDEPVSGSFDHLPPMSTRVTQVRALGPEFCLSKKDLAPLPYITKPNPHYRKFAPKEAVQG